MTRQGGGITEQMARTGVTEREIEVLSAVAERLRNREIAERLHLSVRTVESHIAALLRKFGVTDRAALVELGAELRRSAHTESALPMPLTSMIGREHEVGEVAALVDAHRLVTLIGPAGVGKTRLVLRLAAIGADSFPDGARFADLAPVGLDLVSDTIARALGVVPQPGWSLRDILREVAGGMRCLLVVDNCEHVIAEAAEIVADLLTAGSRLHVLATSREPLGVPGEVTYQVQTLPVPPPIASDRAETARTYDAVRLFVDRATTASPGFVLTDAVAPAVAALCRRLDGLPLAIELAASRMRSFEPADLVEHLDERFELLSAGARTALPRQQTLRGAIDWSYELLDDDERTLFDRLGVFPADFDYDAARAVGSAGVITLLPRLVDKSLVSTAGRTSRRYRMLETIRAYAAERLTLSGAEPTVRQHHASHYLALAEQAAEKLRTKDQRAWADRLTAEQPNLRTGLAYCIATGEIESAWRWIAALQRFWDITGQRREGQDWIRKAQAIGDPPATPAVVAGLAAASTMLHSSDSRGAFDIANEATRLAAGLDDISRAKAAHAVGMGAMWIQPELTLPALTEALVRIGDDHPWDRALIMEGLSQAYGELREALHWGRESVALFRRVGDQLNAANALFIMAQRAMYAGVADDEVHEWLIESQALAVAAGSEEDQVHATVAFAQLAWQRGHHDDAALLMSQCLPTLRRLGDQRCTGRALYLLGERAYEQRDLARAQNLLAGSVAAVALAGQSFVLVRALEALAAVLSVQGRSRPAAVLLGAADTALGAATAHMRPLQPRDDELRRSLVQVLGAEEFNAAHREGQRLSPTQALHLAAPGQPSSQPDLA
ncbi:putative ATPase [Kribbella sp. VKM Ac-2527]|uniref:Putative ATPase n=1 Tax=Kribbella caucasensis TaxID=2512215 RepID=A0A4R6K9T9_9ACTN|nr:LuxR C-terminal-related transcriptional regulator [Kribbella sp. VKM Ac-2527]TDO45957.1 putative ATPase [Kribbella sp. VKM Ac-2527]